MGLTAEYLAISKLCSITVATWLWGYVEYLAISKLFPLAYPHSPVLQRFGFGLRLGSGLVLGLALGLAELNITAATVPICRTPANRTNPIG